MDSIFNQNMEILFNKKRSYTVEYWYRANGDDYDYYQVGIDARSENEAIEKVKLTAPAGSNSFKIV